MAVERVRAASKEMLGNKYRVEIGAAIHTWAGEKLNSLTVADYTGIRYPRVQEDLKRLAAAGLLEQIEDPGSRTVEYKAASSVYWEFCSALLAELGESGDD